ncbi:MAG: hypothetical protein L0Y43_11205 [Methylococcaceae bacterium]|nr:hypothetical protein [Methylococcaceae bacterium]
MKSLVTSVLAFALIAGVSLRADENHPISLSIWKNWGWYLFRYPVPPKFKRYSTRGVAMLHSFWWQEAEPNHPGVAHYVIRGSGYPGLANYGYDARETMAESRRLFRTHSICPRTSSFMAIHS